MALKLNGTNSVAAPAYAGAHADTGLQCGTDEVNLVTGGTARLKIDSSGNVGIGTTSPSAKLHANSGTTDVVADFESSDANAWIQIRDNSTTDTAVMVGAVGDDMRLRAGSNERMRITSAGYVGIGTTSPAGALHVNGTGGESNVSSQLRFSLGGTTEGIFGVASSANNIISGSAQGDTVIRNDGGNINFSVDSGTSTHMRIDSSGNIGIGVTPNTHSLGKALEIGAEGNVLWGEGAGNIHLLSNAYYNSGYKYATSAPAGRYNIYQNTHTWARASSGTADAAATFTESMRIDSSGNVGIGTTSPSTLLHVDGVITSDRFINATNSQDPWIKGVNTSGTETFNVTQAGNVYIAGNVGIGTTSPGSFDSSADNFVISGTTHTGITIDATSSTSSSIHFADGSTGNESYRGIIEYQHNNDAFVFRTAAVERMRILSNGHLCYGKTSTSFSTKGTVLGADGYIDAVRDSTVMYINRLSSDGDLVNFYQDSGKEGSISVSGSTISYNGGHLTRWSQLASGAERTEILRGSVLSNLDEMCEWGEEDNEQLNRMKISDIEGDVNVAGVFQAWDDDDDTYTNDFYCAMTGDFIIRIAQGTTVARGDLLMSAGDGTAKPQDDDIVRSKTIAKVTSTTVSTTYSDGSYCVPCVLMAC